MKKNRVIRLLGLLVAIVIGTYFLVRPNWRFPFDRLSPFEAIPQSSSFAIGFDLINEPNDSLWQHRLWSLEVKNLHQLLDTFSMLESDMWSEWWMLPEELDQGGDVAYTFIGNSNDAFSGAWNAASLGTPMNFGDGEVYGFKIDSDDPLYFARIHNLLVVGKYPFQIEEILDLLKKGEGQAWEDNLTFQKIKDTPKEAKTHKVILQNNGVLADIPERWISLAQKHTINQHFDWLWMEIGQKDSVGVVSAYCSPKAEIHQETSWGGDWKWVPEICQTATPLHLFAPSSSDKWMNLIQPWLGQGGWELVLNPENKEDNTVEELWILPIADTLIYSGKYDEIKDHVGLLDEIAYNGFKLRQLKSSEIFNPLSDRKGLQMWVCELDGALLCSVSREDMERWLDYYIVGGGVGKETDFLIQLRDLDVAPNDGQLLWRWHPLADQETNLYNLLFPRSEWANSGQLLAKIQQNSKAKTLTLTGNISTFEPSISGPSIAWTLAMEMTGEVKLFPVKDIYNNKCVAFAVQNQTGSLLFFDENANVLWENENVAPIIGPLYALPWYNNIMRLLGVTKDGMVFWDENGNQIDQWPLMPSPPSGPICIAHFDQKEEVGIFVPTGDGQIWGFTPQGEILEGWPVPAYSQDTIVTDLFHYQLPTQDLIVSWSDSAGWKSFNRQGDSLFIVKKLLPRSISRPFGQQLSSEGAPSNNRLVVAYETGLAQILSFNGESFTLPLGKGPADRFLLAPTWGDSRADYIVQRGQLVHLFGYEENTFTERWQARFSTSPDSLVDLTPYGILSMHTNKKELWLLDGKGQRMSDFPMAGQQNAFLLNTSTQEDLLLTLLGEEVYAYRLKW